MQYPLYDYYHLSSLTLDEILEHYAENYYLRKHGRNKYEKVLQKLSESDKVHKLFDMSYTLKLSLTYMDMGATLNEILWFFFQSNETQALAILAMFSFWDVNVNSHLHLRSVSSLRDEALLVFKKYSMYGDMSQDEYDRMTMSNTNEIIDNELDDESNDTSNSNYHILNFYLDCSYWHKQEDEIKKCPLVLPVKIIDVDEEDDIVSKYKVNNLPTLILVDGDGNEIHRWVGITPSSGINDYLTENGYDENESKNENEEDNEDYPQPLNVPFSVNDELKLKSPEFQDKVIAIMADGGTKDQIKVKLEILLNKRQPTENMKEVERIIRNFFRRSYDAVGEIIIEESNGDAFLQKLTATIKLVKCNTEIDDIKKNPAVKQMQETANNYCVSWNIIKDEEYKRALAIYRDGKQVE